jgi:hypothetical protein
MTGNGGHGLDLSEPLRKKEQRRRRLAKLSFEEKIAIVRRLQELSRAVKANGRRPRRGVKR